MKYTKRIENKLIKTFIDNKMRAHENRLLSCITKTEFDKRTELNRCLKIMCENINKTIKVKIVRDYKFYLIKF